MLSGSCCRSLLLFFVLFVFLDYCASSLLCARQVEQNTNELGYIAPPNDHDFYEILSKPENFGKMAELFFDIVKKQNPVVSSENLLKIVDMKQRSINDFRCKYSVLIEIFDKNQDFGTNKNNSYEFCYSGNKLYLEYIPIGAGIADPPEKRSYDGEKVLSLLSYSNGHLHAGIEKADIGVLRVFFQPCMPLVLAMLFDTDLCKFDSRDISLVSFLQWERLYAVFEKKEIVDECECIVVADLSNRIYLDPRKDFSVIQSETYNQVFSEGTLVGRWLTSRSKLFDLVNYGNGIWIPSKAVIENYDESGKVTIRYIVDVSLVEVNKGIDDNYFTGFIPDDTLVADVSSGMVYEWSDRPSINGLLKETVKSKRVFIFQYISVTIGILLILIWITVKYLAYRKRKKSEQRESLQ